MPRRGRRARCRATGQVRAGVRESSSPTKAGIAEVGELVEGRNDGGEVGTTAGRWSQVSSWIAPAAGVVFDRIDGSMLRVGGEREAGGCPYPAPMRWSGTERGTSLCRVAD